MQTVCRGVESDGSTPYRLELLDDGGMGEKMFCGSAYRYLESRRS